MQSNIPGQTTFKSPIGLLEPEIGSVEKGTGDVDESGICVAKKRNETKNEHIYTSIYTLLGRQC